MKVFITMVMLLASMIASAATFEELVDGMTEPLPARKSEGVISELSYRDRSIVISGYEYLVGPPTILDPLEVSLYGTTAGSFELLSAGMKVEVEYIDLGQARIAFIIRELNPNAEVEF